MEEQGRITPYTHEQAGHRKASLESNAPKNQEASSMCVSRMQLVPQ